jgi:hypothetical protein
MEGQNDNSFSYNDCVNVGIDNVQVLNNGVNFFESKDFLITGKSVFPASSSGG